MDNSPRVRETLTSSPSRTMLTSTVSPTSVLASRQAITSSLVAIGWPFIALITSPPREEAAISDDYDLTAPPDPCLVGRPLRDHLLHQDPLGHR